MLDQSRLSSLSLSDTRSRRILTTALLDTAARTSIEESHRC